MATQDSDRTGTRARPPLRPRDVPDALRPEALQDPDEQERSRTEQARRGREPVVPPETPD